MTEVLAEAQYAQWDAFVLKAKGGTIFHTSWFLRGWTEDLRIIVLRDAQGQIEAGIPLTEFRFLGTKAARRPPWTAYNGPLVASSSKGHAVGRASDEKGLMLRLLAQSPELGMYDYILHPAYTDVMPFLWNGFDTNVGYTYQIPPSAVEQWQRAMASSHRRDLRKAHDMLKELGGNVETTMDLEEFFPLLDNTFNTKKYEIQADRSTVCRWWKAVTEHQAGTIYLARGADSRAVCATMLIYDHVCSYYLASGICAEARRGPMNLWSRVLIDCMIRDSHSRGLTFDFEGSALPGVEHFFRGWGGQCVPRYRVVKIPKLHTYLAWTLYHYWMWHRKRAGCRQAETSTDTSSDLPNRSMGRNM